MANHRQVGKCQLALPYVEPASCAAASEQELLAGAREGVHLYFAGASQPSLSHTPSSEGSG